MPDAKEEDLIPKYSVLVAVNPIGSIIFAPLGGFLANKIGKKRPILTISLFALVASSALYSLVSLTEEGFRYPLLIVGRFTAGASSGELQ